MLIPSSRLFLSMKHSLFDSIHAKNLTQYTIQQYHTSSSAIHSPTLVTTASSCHHQQLALLTSVSVATRRATSIRRTECPLITIIATPKRRRTDHALILCSTPTQTLASHRTPFIRTLHITIFHIIRNVQIVAAGQVTLSSASFDRPWNRTASTVNSTVVKEASEGCHFVVASGRRAFFEGACRCGRR